MGASRVCEESETFEHVSSVPGAASPESLRGPELDRCVRFASRFQERNVRGCYRYGATGLRTKMGGFEHVSSVPGAASPESLRGPDLDRCVRFASRFQERNVRGCHRYGATGLRTKMGGFEHVSSVRGAASLVVEPVHDVVFEVIGMHPILADDPSSNRNARFVNALPASRDQRVPRGERPAFGQPAVGAASRQKTLVHDVVGGDHDTLGNPDHTVAIVAASTRCAIEKAARHRGEPHSPAPGIPELVQTAATTTVAQRLPLLGGHLRQRLAGPEWIGAGHVIVTLAQRPPKTPCRPRPFGPTAHHSRPEFP